MIEKTYLSPRWTNELLDCSMPMTFDTYSNCSFGCLYCFSQYQRAIGTNKNNYLNKTNLKSVNIDKIKKMFLEPETTQFGNYIKMRKTMQWGGLSDQFDKNEEKYGITLELLKFFKEINYPLCFSTKAISWTKDERYLELFKGQKNWNVKFSIITLDEQKAKIMEAGVPTPKERLEALKTIANLDCGGATLRLRPFIIGLSTPTYLELIQRAIDNGAKSLSTEFFCLDIRSEVIKKKMPIFNKLCGYDVFELYKKYSSTKGYLRLNRNIKRPFIQKMADLCKKNNIQFSVSDQHFKELCYNGCCCGLNNDFNFSKGTFCTALVIARKNGKVYFKDIKTDIEKIFKNIDYTKLCGYNHGTTANMAKFTHVSTLDYFRYQWNSLTSAHSPYRMFEGVLLPDGVDEEKNIIYKYNSKASLNNYE